MTITATGEQHCWVCESPDLELGRRTGIDVRALGSQDFAISDSRYGRTGDIYRCRACGFLECPDLDGVLGHYQGLVDQDYEQGRAERALQARQLLATLAPWKPAGRLLDVGAGSGILVEQALARGYAAKGIEPSEWLQRRAADRGLPVYQGTLPHPDLPGPFDLVTLIDVIEHVPDPVGILQKITSVLAPDGLVAVVTPDVRSVAAQLLGFRWWHYRVAHVGYFHRGTLDRALARSGLERLATFRPGWYFTVDYLLERVRRYLPLPLPVPSAVRRLTIPLNLRDSLLVVARRHGAPT